LDISADGGDGHDFSAVLVPDRAILRIQAAVDFDGIPLFGVSNVAERHAKLLSPKIRD
jgi:hypothetical protein